jgi:hypothetical protein
MHAIKCKWLLVNDISENYQELLARIETCLLI